EPKRDDDGVIVGGTITLQPMYSKNKKSYTIPLMGDAPSILQRAWNARDPECPFVFQRKIVRRIGKIKKSYGRRIGDIRKSWYKAAEAAGLQKKDAPVGERFRFHDLRDCAATNLNDAGVGDRDAMMITGHKTTSMFDRYVQRQQKNIGAALERVSKRNRALAAEKSNVIPLKRKTRYDK